MTENPPTKKDVYNLFRKYGLVCSLPNNYTNIIDLYINGRKFKSQCTVWVFSDGEYSNFSINLTSDNFHVIFKDIYELEKAVAFMIQLGVQ